MKKLLLITTLFWSLNGEANPETLKACDLALNACGQYVQTLTEENALLRQQAIELRRQREEALKQAEGNISEPLLPGWAWLLIGIGGGAAIGGAL